MNAHFVLIHSPLCGPGTWEPVAEELRQRGFATLVPPLCDGAEVRLPYWRRQVAAVVGALGALGALKGGTPLVLIGHSGAGPLLPAIGQSLARAIGAYIFADAALPHPGQSRLDELAENLPAVAPQLRAHLDAGGRYPTWGDDDLRTLVPDASRRARVLAELRPRTLDFFSEPLPTVPGWPDAPCAYLRFSAAYARPAEEAERSGWPVIALEAGHFHQLVAPRVVADALLALARTLVGKEE